MPAPIDREIRIESGVPLPRSRSALKEAFGRMGVGDSFLVTSDMNLSSVRAAATRYGIDHGITFTVRKSPKGPRCWRVA